MPGDDTPWSASLTGPHPRVAIGPRHSRTANSDLETGTKGGDVDVLAHPTDPQFLGLVLEQANGARSVGLEILRLGRELSVRPGEQEFVGDEPVQGSDVGTELCGAELFLQGDDLGVGITDDGHGDDGYGFGHE